jgi:hypothetical protein
VWKRLRRCGDVAQAQTNFKPREFIHEPPMCEVAVVSHGSGGPVCRVDAARFVSTGPELLRYASLFLTRDVAPLLGPVSRTDRVVELGGGSSIPHLRRPVQ